MKQKGSLAFDLEVHVRKGTSFMVYFHFITLYFLPLSVLFSINWRPQCLWHLSVKGLQGKYINSRKLGVLLKLITTKSL